MWIRRLLLIAACVSATSAEAGDCLETFGTVKTWESDWQVATLQSMLHADAGGRCSVLGFSFEHAAPSAPRRKDLVVADLAAGQLFRIEPGARGVSREKWVGFTRADVLALDPSFGFRLGEYESDLGNDPVEVTAAIARFVSAHAALADFRSLVEVKR